MFHPIAIRPLRQPSAVQFGAVSGKREPRFDIRLVLALAVGSPFSDNVADAKLAPLIQHITKTPKEEWLQLYTDGKQEVIAGRKNQAAEWLRAINDDLLVIHQAVMEEEQGEDDVLLALDPPSIVKALAGKYGQTMPLPSIRGRR